MAVDSNWALVGLTAVLAVATFWYAYAAHATLRQLKKDHDFSLQPSVIVQKWRGAAVQLANLGRGPGLNINVRLSFQKEDGSFVFLQGRHPGLAPGEKDVLILQVIPQPESGVPVGHYGGPGIARVQLGAQNVITGKFQDYLDKALRPDYNWPLYAPLPN